MRSFLSRQASPGTAISLVALFVALSGTAVALPGKNRVDSNDPKRGSIGTRAIANNSVRSSDIRTNNVRTSDINNGSVTGDDVDEGTFDKVPSAANADSATSASSAGNANTLGGASLNSIGKGRDAFDESCDPNSNGFVDCLGPTIAVTRPSKILIQTTGAWFSGGAAAAGGQCLLQENDVTISNAHEIGENTNITAPTRNAAMPSFVDVVTVNPGTYRYEVTCNENTGDIKYKNQRVAVTTLGTE